MYAHVVGVDIIRTGIDEFFVLEDNARVPSGVSYMMENRSTMLHMFPELFTEHNVRPISNYPKELFNLLQFPVSKRIYRIKCGRTHPRYFQLSLL